MRCVIIESPYAGAVPRNLAYLRACMADSLGRGEAPYASHGLYTQAGVLDDTKPEERRTGMMAGFAWNERADATVVYQDFGISPGMAEGVKNARTVGRFVEFRRLEKEVVARCITEAARVSTSVHLCAVCGVGLQTSVAHCIKCPRPAER